MNQGSNDMYQASDGKWYPKQVMPQGWQQGPDGSYIGPNGQTQYGGQQQQYPSGNYGGMYSQQAAGGFHGAPPAHYGQQQPMYIKQGRPGGGAGAAGAAGGGILAGLCCGALCCDMCLFC